MKVYLVWEEHEGDETLISVCETEACAEERVKEWNSLYNRGRPLTPGAPAHSETARWHSGRRAYCIVSQTVARSQG